MTPAPRALVDAYERGLDPDDRRARGVHQTPAPLARGLVDLALDEFVTAAGRLPSTVLDPSCGGGAFLLAAADALVARGVSPHDVVDGVLVGAELDPHGARVARDALVGWAQDHGVPERAVQLPMLVGDALVRPRAGWSELLPGGADLVVGNPPFLSPLAADVARPEVLREALRERFGIVGRTIDAAALFLLLAAELLSDDGVAVLLQPRSVLSAADVGAVRQRLAEDVALVGLWSDDGDWFDAAVQVCAPVLRRGPQPPQVAVSSGVPAQVGHRVPWPGVASWGPLLSPVYGVPAVDLPAGPSLSTLATATAGFRDEYYALRDAVVDSPAGDGPPLATVGMVDAAALDWGVRPAKVGGANLLHPRVDLSVLAATSPRVAAWAAARSVPKVLVAAQTKVVEAVADPVGHVVPMTPLISVEPVDPADLWRVAAVLLAPPVSARAVSLGLGSGRSAATLRWSASAALQTPLPEDAQAWADGAALAEQLHTATADGRAGLLEQVARTMTRAYGLDPDLDAGGQVVGWWLQRAVVRRPARAALPV